MRKWARGEPIEWDVVVGDYRATVDFPGANFYAELAEAYPEAKVVLTVRDPQRWYDSARSAFGNVPTIDPSTARGYLTSKAMSTMQEMREGSGMAFDGSPKDGEHATKDFERHIREVKERVPARRLLAERTGPDSWAALPTQGKLRTTRYVGRGLRVPPAPQQAKRGRKAWLSSRRGTAATADRS